MTAEPALVGAVFDLDGTLVDNIRYHYAAFRTLAERLGLTMDEATFQKYNGLKNEDIFPGLVGRALSPEELAALADEKERTYRALFGPELVAHRGAPELLARLRARGVKLAVASSAPPANRKMVLDGLAWNEVFDAVVASEGLRGKPAPDVFLAAAERLGVAPSQCVAFEDAANGVQAAAAAGMLVVGVTTNVGAEALVAAGARFTVAHFDELPAEIEARLPR
ncbi:MAG: Beta-phosphoglucomutase [Labilithrix sp.]|nr:Beta-phosphoglucomutase [Labilithrix sp.]